MKTKKTLMLVLMIFIISTLFTSCSKENSEPVVEPEQVVEITDANFKAVLLANTSINTNKDDEIQESEALAFKGKLNVSNKEIQSLAGIEAFTNLTELDCSKNSLTELDMSKNTKITALYCQENKIKTVLASASKGTSLQQSNTMAATQNFVLSQNTALTILNCSNNELETLDISKNTALTNLDCSNNNLKSLDLSKNTTLTDLDCSNNQLESIDLSKNTALTNVDVSFNNLKAVDFSKNLLIKIIDASNNSVLAEINIANGNNQSIVSVNLTESPNLVTIKVDDIDAIPNGWQKDETATYQDEETITIVNIPDANFKAALLEHGKSIVKDGYDGDEIPEISIIDTNGDGEIQVKEAKNYTGTIKIVTAKDIAEDKKITDLTGIEVFVNLTGLKCSAYVSFGNYPEFVSTGKIQNMDISKNIALKVLNCDGNQLSELNIEKNTDLEYIYASYNKIASINTSNNQKLKLLGLDINQLTELDLSNNPDLETVSFEYNQIAQINTTSNANLKILDCIGNNISSIDISNNPNLTVLLVDNNQLTSLDVNSNVALTGLYCKNNQITSLDVSNHTALKRFQCSNNPLTCIQVNATQLANIPAAWSKDIKARYSTDCDGSGTSSVITSEGTLIFTDAPSLSESMSLLASCTSGSTIYINQGYQGDIQQYDTNSSSGSTTFYSGTYYAYPNIEHTNAGFWSFNGYTSVNSQRTYNQYLTRINDDGDVVGSYENPNPKKSAGSAVWNDKIYTFGGSNNESEYSNKLYSFDTNTLQWQQLTSMPEAKECKGEIINGKIYVIGGYNGEVSKRIDVYDITTDMWTYLGEIPYGISSYATTASANKIWFVGDYSELTNVASFDVGTYEFKTYTTNMNPRRHCAAEYVNGKLYVLGGNSASNLTTSTNSVQVVEVE